VAGRTRVNSYILSIRNRTGAEASYSLRSGSARIILRDELRLPPGGAGTFTFYAALDTKDGQGPPERIKIEVIAEGASEGTLLEIGFPLP
jgi:hypothetical protein